MLIHNAAITGSLTLNGIDIGDITGSESSIASLNQATASLSSSIAILSGSFLTTSASYSSASGSFSQRVTTIEGKYATTGSNSFNGSQTVTGSLTVTNQIVAQTLSVQQVTSSIIFSSGSNVFGNSLSNTQQLTGSVSITGSLSVNGTSAVVGTGTTNYIPKFTNGSAIGNSLVYDSGTAVGIGTTSPTANTVLDVSTTGTRGYIIAQSTSVSAGSEGGLRVKTNTKDYYIFTDNTSDALRFYDGTASAERMRLTASGNLGLGVTPSAWSGNWKAIQLNGGSLFSYLTSEIHVGQNFYNSTSAISNYLSNGYATDYWQYNGQHIWMTAPSGTAGAAITFTQAMTLNSSGNLGINTTSPGEKLTVNGTIGLQNSGTQNWGIYTTSANNLVFQRSGIADRMTLSSDGNLGLGVQPSAWGSSWKAFEFAAAAIAWTGAGANDFSFSTNSFFDATDSRWEYKSTGDGAARYSITALTSEHRWYNAPVGTAGNAITFTQAMTLTANGRLLLGTTTEGTHLLDVNGTGRFSGITTFGSTGGSGLRVYGASGTNQWDMYLNGANIRFSDNTGTGSFVVDRPATFSSSVTATNLNLNNGDTFINVTSTLRGLQFGYAGPSHGSYRAAVMGGAENYGGTDSGMLTFHTQNGYVVSAIPPERMRITSDGNVGIGTTSPGSILETYASTPIISINGTTLTGSRGIEFKHSGENLGHVKFNASSGEFGISAGKAAFGSYITFTTDTAERMRIASTGNVGIGTTSPNGKMTVIGNTVDVRNGTGGYGTGYALEFSTNANIPRIDWIDNGVYTGNIKSVSGEFYINNSSNNALILSTNNTERMRITSGGALFLNATTNPLPDNATPQFGMTAATSTDAVNLKHLQNGNNTFNIWQTGTTQHNAIAFYKGDTQTNRGNIVVTTSGTSYNTASDYRLKENVMPLENGLDRLMQLKPSKFNWIETGNESEGFIAHELQEYFPDAVTGEKDAVYSSTGKIKPQSVDYGRITPLLVKALQELKAELDALKNK
jgi:hypothetical protein